MSSTCLSGITVVVIVSIITTTTTITTIVVVVVVIIIIIIIITIIVYLEVCEFISSYLSLVAGWNNFVWWTNVVVIFADVTNIITDVIVIVIIIIIIIIIIVVVVNLVGFLTSSSLSSDWMWHSIHPSITRLKDFMFVAFCRVCLNINNNISLSKFLHKNQSFVFSSVHHLYAKRFWELRRPKMSVYKWDSVWEWQKHIKMENYTEY